MRTEYFFKRQDYGVNVCHCICPTERKTYRAGGESLQRFMCGGSAPLTRFVLGFCVMVGALMFLGCPFHMILRIAGGDLNAVVGIVGFIGESEQELSF